ncbi:MAG: Acetoacetate decarboxylase [Pseudomonadota bacterium]
MSRYDARQAVNAFFLAPTEALARLLPPGLSPLEARPRHGVLAITSFDFSASEVGPYAELALSVLVSPYCPKGEALPHAATFPFFLMTTTQASAEDARTRWALPCAPYSGVVQFSHDAERYTVEMSVEGVPALRLSVRRGPPAPSTRIYQLFTRREASLYRVALAIEGPFEERDDEGGRLELFDHPVAAMISELLADDTPILEQSMEAGVQRFGVLTPFGGAA